MDKRSIGYLLAGLAHESYKPYFKNKLFVVKDIFEVNANKSIRDLIAMLTEGAHGRESYEIALRTTTHKVSDKSIDEFLKYYDEIDNNTNKTQFETVFSNALRKEYNTLLSKTYLDGNMEDAVFSKRMASMEDIFVPTQFNNADIFTDINYADIDTKKIAEDEVKNVFRSAFPEINDLFTYEGYPNGTVNAVCGPPGTGKSLWLMNEAAAFLDDEYQKEIKKPGQEFRPINVLYLAIGDLRQYSFKSRFSSIVCDIPKEMSGNNLVFYDAVVNEKIPAFADSERFKILFAAPGMFTMEQLYKFFKTATLTLKDGSVVRYIDHFNAIMFDYDSNIHSESESLHDKGGEIYSFADILSTHGEGKMIYMASQPKSEYWEAESIPLIGMGESVRKQHTIDFLVTLSNPSTYSDGTGKGRFYKKGMNAVGTANVCKNRDGKKFNSYFFRDVSGKFYFISEAKYKMLMNPPEKKKEYTFVKAAADNFPSNFSLMEQS